ncbi:hypothetical protein [Novosphingobium sp. NDB2Meth1]|uniref:hypothetical protein n=1 Tax=Novosphingobium sp. NDB2Meth1 TaxID=1892847 RepID=UPI0015C556AB|nr:hypothetical protein [Novosphingobium sp. NDB2Meth1]
MPRPAYAAADNAAIRHADFRDYTKAVLASAKLRDSILVARGLPPIGMPHINDNARRGALEPSSHGRNCTGCGSGLNGRKNKSGLCLTCFNAARRAEMKKCAVCSTPLTSKNTTGRCRAHRVGPRTATPTDAVRLMLAKIGPMLRIEAADVLGGSREANAVEARCVIAVALRNRGHSLNQIGVRLGRDHSSIKCLIANLPLYIERNPDVAKALEVLA